MSGVVSARSTNSGIEIKGSTKINSAGTTNGNIEISITDQSSGDMDFSTTNGSITYMFHPISIAMLILKPQRKYKSRELYD